MDTIRFVTNITNPCGKAPSLEEYAAKLLKEAAGEAAPQDAKGKKCDKGQVISDKGEAGEGHQCGESETGEKKEKEAKTETPTKTAECGKEMGESGDAGKVTEKHTKAAPGNDENKEPQVLINNDPNYQKGESPKASKVTPKNKKTEATAQKPVKKASSDWVKISNLNPKSKSKLRSYWSILYPRAFVDAMIQDR